MTNSVVFATAYMVPILYIAYIKKAQLEGKKIFIESNENFIKQSYRNRFYISTANGLESLSIPIESNDGKKISIKDVRISSHGNWIHKHINAIKTAYGSSPFFEYYIDDIFSILKKGHNFLWDLNMDILYKSMKFMQMEDVEILETKEYFEDYLYDISYRYTLSPKVEIKNNEIIQKIKYYTTFNNQNMISLQKLNIFDLIFNMGPESILVINKAIK